MTEQMLYGALLTLLSGVLWYWVRGVDERGKDNRRDIERIKESYQRREDARHDHAQVMDMLKDMKRNLEKINDKLDQKADK